MYKHAMVSYNRMELQGGFLQFKLVKLWHVRKYDKTINSKLYQAFNSEIYASSRTLKYLI